MDGHNVDPQTRSLNGEEGRQEAVTPDPSLDRLSGFSASFDNTRQPTPELSDDPTKFESAKQKKTTLLEGVKKFNFKPKRVRLHVIIGNYDREIDTEFAGYPILLRDRIHSKPGTPRCRSVPARD